MVALQGWTSWSIYEGLGEFGWFYGDFFLLNDTPATANLTYTGIYRYLNNPEKIVGQAAYFGLALLAYSPRLLLLAILSLITNMVFLEYVERPHMGKVYGEQLRGDSGVTRNVKRVPGAIKVEKVGERVVEIFEGLERKIINNLREVVARPKRNSYVALTDFEDGIELEKYSFEMGEAIPFKASEVDGKIAFWKDGEFVFDLLAADCVGNRIPSVHVPWMAGTFKMSIGSNVKSRPFTIQEFPEKDLPIKEALSSLMSKVNLSFDKIATFGPNHVIFTRLSEAISSLYDVELAPLTIFQYSTETELLASRIKSISLK